MAKECKTMRVQCFKGVRVRAAATWEEWPTRQKSQVMKLGDVWTTRHDVDLMIARYVVCVARGK